MLRGLSPVIASVIVLAVTLAVAFAVAGYVFGIFHSSTSNSLVANSLCKPVIWDAKIYVDNSGCGVAILEIEMPKECTVMRATHIDVGGRVSAAPAPTLQTQGTLSPGHKYYILVYYDRGRRAYYFYPFTSENIAVAIARTMFTSGRCIPGFSAGSSYLGRVHWASGRLTVFMWFAVPSSQLSS